MNSRIDPLPGRRVKASVLWTLVAGCYLSETLGGGAVAARAKAVPGLDLFTNGPIPLLRIEIAADQVTKLRQDSRKNVKAKVTEGNTTYSDVAIHLKGATGSFRSIDDKPGLTLNFSKFGRGQKFHGLRKIHLNNSVEDPSYLNEYLGTQLFLAAGVPAPRTSHALVQLNGRSLGLYVLKEGFTEDFLSLHFPQPTGNLYDTGDEGHDVNEALVKDSGKGVDDRSDLKALAAAAQEQDLGVRWKRLQENLDMERFISFMAMEVLVGHRDGYCLARNNFRVYHDVDSGKMLFFPHGMDQLFGKPDNTYKPRMSGLVAKAIMETPDGKKLYRQRFGMLFSNVFHVVALGMEVDRKVAQLRPVLGFQDAALLEREAAVVKQRMANRYASLQKQLNEAEQQPVNLRDGFVVLKDWRPVDEPPGGKMDRSKGPGGKLALRISAGPVTAATWRCKVLVEKGRYRFEGLVCISGVEPLAFGNTHGAALRIQGSRRPQGTNLLGTTTWQKLQAPFEVTEAEKEVELVCELRASKGDAWFDLDSLRLVRLP